MQDRPECCCAASQGEYPVARTSSPLQRDGTKKATTDYSEIRAHGNEILNISKYNFQAYFQQDKDWLLQSEERRWITMNDNSSWRRIERVGSKLKRSVMHAV